MKGKIDKFSRTLFSKDILQQLRKEIITGELPAHYRLVENQLAEEYGVSRGPIRTALYALEKEGLIQALPNGGAEVVGFTKKQASDLFAVRLYFEELAGRIIIGQPQFSTTRLIEICNEMKKVNQINTFLNELDIEFHTELVRLSNNWALLQTWLTVSPVISTLQAVTNNDFMDVNFIIEEHLKLVEILDKRQLKLYIKTINEHIERPKKLILKRLEDSDYNKYTPPN